ncbi:hypothetical protein [Amycolatopsis palatopharyngis]|uniref:hypothetical protein n=1 Tax=Amycolatopsis palatopharyngis TaxID=187982 RepID=UPI000E25AD5D|nr:hypothetical protein [Amycolatopsis palatopharyngis]
MGSTTTLGPRWRRSRLGVGAVLATGLALGGCAANDPPPTETSSAAERESPSAGASEQRFPDVLDATISREPDGLTVAATISSPYDSPERYADAFRVRSVDGRTVFGVRELAHDHAGEQPFTRSLTGLEVPSGTDRVEVQARDMANGWGGATHIVAVPPK